MELDPALLADFITESTELLEDYSSSLSSFEANPENIEAINPVFRAAHTLKGSSAFFGLNHIKDFAHKLENLLDNLRHKTRVADQKAIEYLFLGGNFLKAMFERLQAGDMKPELTPEEAEFQEELVKWMGDLGAINQPEEKASFEDACQNIKSILSEALEGDKTPEESLQSIAEIIEKLPLEKNSGKEKAPTKKIKSVFYENVDFTPQILKLQAILQEENFNAKEFQENLTELEGLLNQITNDDLENNYNELKDDFVTVYNSGLDFDSVLLGLIQSKFEALLNNFTLAFEEDAIAQENDEKQQQQKENVASSQHSKESTEPSEPKEKVKEHKTMRISEEKVDGFMSYVGELIVTAESFNYLQKKIEQEKVNPNTIRAFKNANQAFRELSDELQESLMEIRRVPINGVLQKVNMMARELSHQLGKKVRVQLEGQDVQIDKSIAESLEGPLVHLVRNSLDHGMETAEERSALPNKPDTGLLKVSASSDKEFFYLIVEDDGRGIDPEKMRRVAVNKQLMTQEQAESLTDKEAVNLIFGAGFSTANAITDISGRGVGMDVVRTNINALNGSINVESKLGHGTIITMKIPLSVTLQVVKALHVRVGEANFIISLASILESLKAAKEELSTIEGKGLVLNRRGQITPLMKLYEIFNLEADHSEVTDGLVVMLETSTGRYAILVDEVMGQQQVVVKELGTRFKDLNFLAGSALLGDGGLGLVLDADGLVDFAFKQ